MIDQIVDAHHHLWDLGKVHYPWLMARGVTRFFGDPTPIQHDYLVNDFLDDIGDLPVTKSVHIQVGADLSDSITETRWLQSGAERTPQGMPNAIIAFCDLAAKDADEILDAHAESSNLRGVRQIVGRSPDEDSKSTTGLLLDNPTWIENLARLPSRRLSFDLQLIPEQLPAITKVLGDRGCCLRGLDPLQRGLVAGCDDDNAFRQTLLAQIAENEFVYFSATFPDQCNHDHVRGTVPGHHAQDNALAHA